MSLKASRHRTARRAFTLVEVIVAGLVAALVLGSVSVSLGQIGRAKRISIRRCDAYLRADAALNQLRRDIASVMRADDLFFTRFLVTDNSLLTPLGDVDRDELLIFNTRLRPIHDLDNFSGEGIEYETQYRIAEDEYGPVLWQRRDAVPDKYPLGGGVATPLVEGLLGLQFEAYDGEQWFNEWDSDYDGLPHAVRITVTASGHRNEDDLYDDTTPIAILRTVVAIDRVIEPRDHAEYEEQLLRELEALEQQESGEGDGAPGDILQNLPPGVEMPVLDPSQLGDLGSLQGGQGGGQGQGGSGGQGGGTEDEQGQQQDLTGNTRNRQQ